MDSVDKSAFYIYVISRNKLARLGKGYYTWLSVVVTTAPEPTVAADLAATGEAEAEVVGVVPFRGLVAVLVASLTS